MTVQTKAVIKSYFETGDYPTQSNFVDLIDSYQDYGTGTIYAVDTGLSNAYVINPSPAITSYQAGQSYAVKILHANSGGSVLSVNGLPSQSITYMDGSTLSNNALPLGAVPVFEYDGTKFQLVNITPGTGGTGITQLTGDVTASGTGAVAATITNKAVTYAKIQDVGANSILANATTGPAALTEIALAINQLFGRGASGNLSPIALGSGLTMSGTTLSSTSSGGGQLNLSAITSSGTFTTSANITTNTKFKFIILGGGGGGGNATGASGDAAGGGGSGGYAIYEVSGLSPSTSYTVTIGAGGTANAAGGNTSVIIGVTTVTANGGAAGTAASVVGSPGIVLGGLGGTCTNGTINTTGSPGSNSVMLSATIVTSGEGGNSMFGGAGRSVSALGTGGNAALSYGSGGSGAVRGGSNVSGGAGFAGIVIVEWIE